MKVVLQSSSLLFTVLSIVLNAPIRKVERKPAGREETRASTKKAASQVLGN